MSRPISVPLRWGLIWLAVLAGATWLQILREWYG